jgi:hypothetical protein
MLQDPIGLFHSFRVLERLEKIRVSETLHSFGAVR